MSDTFDHETAAFECLDFDNDYPDNGRAPTDPLYYHTQLSYKEIKYTTTKAILFKFTDIPTPLWVPEALIKELDKDAQTVYVHTEFLQKKNERNT